MSKLKCAFGFHQWGNPIPYGAYDTWAISNALTKIQVCRNCPKIKLAAKEDS